MTFDPSRRPRAHFTPRRDWMNDPNGLLYHDGEYHLFFQHSVGSILPGNPSWGHAVSRDLVTWTELPVAIASTPAEWVLSGSAVMDFANVSGLGTPQRPAMVAAYTGLDTATLQQRQSLAYSLDRGRTFTRYAGNPVLDIGSTEFRDPKLLRRGDAFTMAIVMAADRTIRLYTSTDLLAWELASEIGGFGFTEGVWECPDLVRVPIEGTADAAWVLLLSVQSGGPVGGSGMQYVVVDFDGTRFEPLGEARWLDHGADCYAAVAFTDAPGPEPVILGWMNNWRYAADIPGGEFRGSMTLPRRLTLRHRDGDLRLVQRPVVAERPVTRRVTDAVVDGRLELPNTEPAVRIVAEVEFGTADRIGLDVRVGDGERTRIVADRSTATLAVDRTRSGVVDFHGAFAGIHSVVVPPTDVLRLDVYVDEASVEVLAADGEVALTDQVFPSPESTGLAVFADGGTAIVRELTVTAL